MNRRSLLTGATVLVAAVIWRPSEALAIGGVLPELEQPAPDFLLPAFTAGADAPKELALADFRGRWLALYFYPKDFTGGCTIEARGFQNDLARFHALNADVVGISADDLSDHASFCDSEGLSYPLLSDPDGTVSQRYGSWLPPYSQRHSFLIDPDGILRARWVAVRPNGHSQELLSELKRQQSLQQPSQSS
ncbi:MULTISPECIES: peroxiredoxin [unclassified Synechococcus]|uniref:peroxiredoxin n=1 Tax=unclassified Synechococcus TaxID=2626047 RepID=UPI0021A7CC0F|nr:MULTISPECIES: peroxiredoxin [unclassified Synechococcus]MCT0214482.1 peroxiredoxin [Synechococcus sp. CS-1326]MCT0233215.1 peroxiredoxin [Synechococcus sp. CS-1327]